VSGYRILKIVILKSIYMLRKIRNYVKDPMDRNIGTDCTEFIPPQSATTICMQPCSLLHLRHKFWLEVFWQLSEWQYFLLGPIFSHNSMLLFCSIAALCDDKLSVQLVDSLH